MQLDSRRYLTTRRSYWAGSNCPPTADRRTHRPSILAISSPLVAPGVEGMKRTSTPLAVNDEYANQLDAPNAIPNANDIVCLRIAVLPLWMPRKEFDHVSIVGNVLHQNFLSFVSVQTPLEGTSLAIEVTVILNRPRIRSIEIGTDPLFNGPSGVQALGDPDSRSGHQMGTAP